MIILIQCENSCLEYVDDLVHLFGDGLLSYEEFEERLIKYLEEIQQS